MTFNTDPAGYLDSDEYTFYKNFPQAWPGGDDFFKSLAHAIDTLRIHVTYSGRINGDTLSLLKRGMLYNYKELLPGLYTLKLLSLDSKETPQLLRTYNSLVVANICLLGLTKTHYQKLKRKPKSDVQAVVLNIINAVAVRPLIIEEYQELRLLMRLTVYYGLASIENLPSKASLQCTAASNYMKDYFSSDLGMYVDRHYLKKVNRIGEKLLPDDWR